MRDRHTAFGLSLALMLLIASPAYANFSTPSTGEVLTGYAFALAITIAFELLTAALLGVQDRRSLIAIALLNVVTNPALVALLSALSPWAPDLVLLLILEVIVIAIEWLVLTRVLSQWSRRRVLRLTVAMNLASLVGGYVVLFVLAQLL